MLDKIFTKLFYAKPTTYLGNRSIVLNFDDDVEKFTVIKLEDYSSFDFYLEEENKKKHYLCFEGVLKSGETYIKKFEFDDEDDAEKALKQVLVSLNGKTKSLVKIALSFIMVLAIIYSVLGITQSVLGLLMPSQHERVSSGYPMGAVPPFAVGQSQGSSWGLTQDQQKELAKLNSSIASMQPTPEQLKAIQDQYANANKLVEGNLTNMRNNRDKMVDGGDAYAQPEGTNSPASSVGGENKGSSASSFINSLQGK